MHSTPVFEQFLANATDLSPGRAIQLYRAGYPWPLFTTQDIRQIALLAQAENLYLEKALTAVGKTADAEHDEMLVRLAELEQTQGKVYVEEKKKALAALPCLQEAFEHMLRVISLTQEKPSTIFRLFLAIQRYAITRPEWNRSLEADPWFPRLVS